MKMCIHNLCWNIWSHILARPCVRDVFSHSAVSYCSGVGTSVRTCCTSTVVLLCVCVRVAAGARSDGTFFRTYHTGTAYDLCAPASCAQTDARLSQKTFHKFRICTLSNVPRGVPRHEFATEPRFENVLHNQNKCRGLHQLLTMSVSHYQHSKGAPECLQHLHYIAILSPPAHVPLTTLR
jgi:hypothetical protein